MRLLCLSTAEQGASLAIVEDRNLLYEEYWSDKRTHSTRVVKMVEHLLDHRVHMTLKDMDAFAVAKGPGSFTGLRIGISVIQGFAYAMGTPALGISSLDGIAFQYAYSSIPVCAMMDAKRNEVYCAVYQFEDGRLISKSKERVVHPQEALVTGRGKVLYAGSGSKAYQTIIEKEAERPVMGNAFLDFVSASALIRALYEKEDFLDSSENILVPSYIRKSDAELQFAEK